MRAFRRISFVHSNMVRNISWFSLSGKAGRDKTFLSGIAISKFLLDARDIWINYARDFFLSLNTNEFTQTRKASEFWNVWKNFECLSTQNWTRNMWLTWCSHRANEGSELRLEKAPSANNLSSALIRRRSSRDWLYFSIWFMEKFGGVIWENKREKWSKTISIPYCFRQSV